MSTYCLEGTGEEKMVCSDLLSRFTEMSRKVFGDNLVGIYLHGSAVMGCFNPRKSDLDLILIVKEDIPDAVKMEFMENVIKYNAEAPAKGMELSIVKKEFCNPFVYPTPYELHFSVSHLKWFQENPEDYIKKMRGADKDLAAHFTIINAYGVTVFGERISEVFGKVRSKDYIDSIRCDIGDARREILVHPIYIVLNLCRVLAYLREELILSKKAGGEWGIHALPEEFHPLIQDALRHYGSDGQMEVSSETALCFADYMISQIEQRKAD